MSWLDDAWDDAEDEMEDDVDKNFERIFSDRDQNSPEVLELAEALKVTPEVVVREVKYGWDDVYRYNRVELPGDYFFFMSQFPGNCGMIVAHSIGTWRTQPCFEIVARKVASALGYTILIATDHSVPAYGTSIRSGLGKRGWTEIPDLTFTNRRTGRDLVAMKVNVR